MDDSGDDTIRLRAGRPGHPFVALASSTPALPPGRQKPRTSWIAIAAGLLAMAGLAGTGFTLLRDRQTPTNSAVAVAPLPVVVPAVPPPPAGAMSPADPPGTVYPIASEAEILASQSSRLTVFRLAGNPAILVFDFPSMQEQARMLNRIAVMIETRGQSRDHPLDDTALDAAIRGAGAQPDSFYDGHDYRAADVLRFFRAADQDGIVLNPEERRLRDILRAAGWFDPANAAGGALISVPTQGVGIDADARAIVLRHEISHGEYFTTPAYVAHTRRFWETDLTEAERAGFRRFLSSQDYDARNEDLMINETQAYLIHTPDARFFRPEMAGLTADRARQLREIFLADMPAGWLRELATQNPPAANGTGPRRAAGMLR